jgi:hypothetical protein
MREGVMKNILAVLALCFSLQSIAVSPWLENLNKENKQQQLDLRWKASGGQADVKFMYNKLNDLNIQISPKPEFADKHWDYNHLVFPISNNSKLELQMPYGNIEKVTAGLLSVDSNFSISNGAHTVQVNSFRLVPTESPLNNSDIVTFRMIDQNDRHLFTIDSVHIEYDKAKGLLLMSNMDLFASKELAQLLDKPVLANQVVGQIHTYSTLTIPAEAETDLRGETCATHPIWPPEADVDVQLIDIGAVQWMRNIGADKIIVAPSARLKNIGTAEVPWYQQFTTPPHDPYNNDQHPFLNWAIYREIDGRFEQLGVSGIKHAFLTINSNCTINCGSSHILWLGCEDVYGTGNNDSSFALGPRAEIEAFTGVWENCGSFFDPMPCTGSHQQSSNGTDENRLSVYTADLTDPAVTSMYMQAWYLIRDDVNIFNSMGYRSIAPTPSGGGWNMNRGPVFKNGAALDNYVTPDTLSAMETSQSQKTGEGQFTVASKVVDLGGGLYRYNYAIENYEFDPRFINYHIPLSDTASFTNPVFSDPEHDDLNNWQFDHSNGQLNVVGSDQNEQDWGMLFSFSFTSDSPPIQGEMTIDAAHPVLNATVNSVVLLPELISKHGFE